MSRIKRIRVFMSIVVALILFLSCGTLSGPDYFLFVKRNPAVVSAAPVTASSFAKNMKVGWNLGNSLDSHYEEPTGDANLGQETIWGNPKITKEQIDYVKSQGFDTIRIPVSWYYHTYKDEQGNLRVHPDWLARVKEVVDYCLADDLYVIMDSHHDGDIFHAGVDTTELAAVKGCVYSVWGDIANYFKDTDERLMFEAFNEPDNYEKYWSFGKNAASQMNELNQLFVDVVRSTGGNNAERILVVPTLLDKHGEEFLNAFSLPKDKVKDRLIVTVHYYPQQFDQSLEPAFTRLEQFSKKVKAPVIIGEWGTKRDYSPSDYRGIHAANFVARAKAHGLNCIYWDNGSNYAIIDRKNLTCNQEIINAIMNPVAFTSEDAVSSTDFEDYLYMTLDQNTGALKEDHSWGTIILSPEGETGLITVPAGSKTISLQLVRSGNMSSQAYHYVYFFDANNTLIDKVNSWGGFVEKNIDLPKGTATVRIGINSAEKKTKKKAYANAIKDGSLMPIVKFY